MMPEYLCTENAPPEEGSTGSAIKATSRAGGLYL